MADVKIVVRAVPDISSAQAAGEAMATAAAQVGAGGRYRGPRPPTIEQAMQRRLQDQGKLAAGMGFLASPMTNPTSLWGNLLSGIALQRALTSRPGQAMLGRFGMGGAGGTMAATGALMTGALAVGLALAILKKSVTETSEAISRAAKLYAYKGMTGFSDQFASQRMTAANVLGVSTEEVMRFGAAMNFLNPRLKHANENFAQSYRRLALVNANWKVLQTNLESLFTTIGNRAAPALNTMANALSNIVITVDNLIQKYPNFFRGFVGGLFGVPVGGEATGLPVGPAGQVPKKASAWERMGLVVGGPVGADRTNQILRAQLNMLQKIHSALAPNIPRGSAPLNPHFHLENKPKA